MSQEQSKSSWLIWGLVTVAGLAAMLTVFLRLTKPFLQREGGEETQIFDKDAPAAANEVSEARLRSLVEKLSSVPSRMAGGAGARQSAEALAAELRGIPGIQGVRLEPMTITYPVDAGAYALQGGRKVRAYPLWAYQRRAQSRTKVEAAPLAALAPNPFRFSGARDSIWHFALPVTEVCAETAKAFDQTHFPQGDESHIPALQRWAEAALQDAVEGGAKAVIFQARREDLLPESRHPLIQAFLDVRSSPVPAYAVLDPLSDGKAVSLEPAFSTLTILPERTENRQPTSDTAGTAIRIYPFWPNGSQAQNLGPGGYQGQLVYGGDGSAEALSGKKIEDSILLLDWEPGRAFMNAAVLGARVLLFAEPDTVSRNDMEKKVMSVSLDLPHFWVTAGEAKRLRKKSGSLARAEGQQTWELGEAFNVRARMIGTDPSEAARPVLLASPYDAFSLVPDLAPGAEQAGGAAVLLETARVLSKHPVRKPLEFFFHAGRNDRYAGLRTEVATLRNRLLQAQDSGKAPEPALPSLILNFENTSRSRQLAICFTGHLVRQGLTEIQRRVSPLGARLSSACRSTAKALGLDPLSVGDAVNPVEGRSWDSYLLGPFAISSELPILAGFLSYTFTTSEDGRLQVSTPQDLPTRMDFGSLAQQARILALSLANVLNIKDVFSKLPLKDYWCRLNGRVITLDTDLSYLPDRSVPGALVFIKSPGLPAFLGGVLGTPILTSEEAALRGGSPFSYEGLPNSSWLCVGGWQGTVEAHAFVLDPITGRPRQVLDQQGAENYNYPFKVEMNTAERRSTILTFQARGLSLLGLVGPRDFKTLQKLDVLDAKGDSPPEALYIESPQRVWETDRSEAAAVVYSKPGTRLKVLMGVGNLGGRIGRRGALLGGTEESPYGQGFEVGYGARVQDFPVQAASDLLLLNQKRMALFSGQGITNTRAQELLDRASEELNEAKKAKAARNYSVYFAKARAAWANVSRAYPDVTSTGDGVVEGALFFLALMLPFAFLTERLFVASPNINKQISMVGLLFGAIFLAFDSVHPAFKISLTPLLILLAFVIFTLVLFVTAIILGRFLRFLKEDREAAQGVHEADAKKGAVAAAAFGMGVSNLRKRPLRTGLTASTLALLIFGILSLTSIQPAERHREYKLDSPAPYDGLLLRERTWNALASTADQAMKDEFQGSMVLARRGWWVSRRTDRQLEIQVTAHGKAVKVSALLGLDPEESQLLPLAQTLDKGSFFKTGSQGQCLLPSTRAATLDVVAGDAVTISGTAFTVAGLFDPAKLAKITDLDGESVMPVDFKASAASRVMEETESSPEAAPKAFQHQQASDTALVSFQSLRSLGGELQSLALRSPNPDQVRERLQPLVTRLDVLVYAGLAGESRLHSAAPGTTAKGMGRVLIPLLLAALIVANTMLGSVQERIREISIFSAVGLAPRHVRNLFLAEASVYAVLGAVVGALVGQGIGRVLLKTGFLAGLSLNYSSSAAIISVFMVMAVVFLSTLYPAAVAARVARPGELRRLEIPEGQSGDVSIPLPFALQGEESASMAAYLMELFEAHLEASAGHFSAGNIRSQKDKKGEFHVHATVWLAPYDFGVSQEVDLSLGEEAALGIKRLSGDEPSWRRSNLRFLLFLRKQFLIWRSLPQTRKTEYADKVLPLHGGGKVPQSGTKERVG